ncbi:S-methyl-5'-thioadenosine phosphorylase [Leifsonia sp. Root112D2]|uniref:S-methyl-5'-thioadenosine phosphorylase n=1 Tax=Leifsonia sp. Root112D2 TaxID=1736426 RepID=UPI0009E7A5F1|nr:S-methyl-5'-thioadenosine phosphorylase [Leifsonia sp. Root112D2]
MAPSNYTWGDAGAAPIGLIGGSGLYRLFDTDVATVRRIPTPYGATSAEVAIGQFAGRQVAFLPRHGTDHSVPPHRIGYRANVWALASLGVRAIVSSSAVGSISSDLQPGAFVVPDQLIDRTWGRDDTFFDAGSVQHLPFADPYCPQLRQTALTALATLGEHPSGTGTTVVVQGPRFSTRAESRWLRSAGGDIVNMTQYPEVALAAELNVGYVNLSFVTDTDAGDTETEAVEAQVVLDRLAAAGGRIREALAAIVAAIPVDYAPREAIPTDAVRQVLAKSPVRGATPTVHATRADGPLERRDAVSRQTAASESR